MAVRVAPCEQLGLRTSEIFLAVAAATGVTVTDSYYHYPTTGPMNGFTVDTRYGGGAGTSGFAGGATPLTDAGYNGQPLQLVEIM